LVWNVPTAPVYTHGMIVKRREGFVEWPNVTQQLAQLGADLMAAWNSHDLDRVAALHAAGFVGWDIAQPEPQVGIEGIRRCMSGYLQAFPDLHLSADASVIEHDQMVLVWRARGTQRGTLMNIPPTGRTVEVQGMTLITVQDGRIARSQSVWDVAGLLRAIGLLPEL
jgi:steroid delta-isomerase-like uncharacterized protein